jgi:23S rRNA pseudouridine1911/1915/1917 synthase
VKDIQKDIQIDIKDTSKVKTKDISLAAKGEKPMRLDAKVRELFAISWGEARDRVYKGKIFINDKACTDIGRSVRPNENVRFVADARRIKPEDELLPKEAFRWIDRDVVVVEKPADLLTVPFEPEDKLTLDRLIQAVLAKREKHQARGSRAARPPIFVVHRLDRGTSGLLVFARNPDAKDGLKDQFREHSAERRYIAIAHGKVRSQSFKTRQVQDRGDGIRGSIEEAPERIQKKLGQGKWAITHVEALEVLGDGEATLISCRLETGRTNQIRIHLSEAGHPLIGETVYLRSFKGEVIPAPRLCLHAETLGFVHPKTGEKMRFTCPVPSEMQTVVNKLRKKKKSSTR